MELQNCKQTKEKVTDKLSFAQSRKAVFERMNSYLDPEVQCGVELRLGLSQRDTEPIAYLSQWTSLPLAAITDD